MAVAAYSSLVSLLNLLDNVYDRIEIQLPRLDAEPFDALRERVNFLLCTVAAHSQKKSRKLEGLWRRVAEVAHEADDIIDAHVVDQLYKESLEEEGSMGHSTFCEDMDGVNQMIDIIKTELFIAIEEGKETRGETKEGEYPDAEEREDFKGKDEKAEDTQGEDVKALKHPKVSSSAHALSSATSSHSKDGTVVGLEEKVIKIMDQLASNEANLQIVTISGMGGIGKTTLAKTVYDDPFTVEYFDVHLWIAVSQEYVVENLLQGLIDSGEKKYFSGLGVSGEDRERGESFSELGEKLYKGLFGRRYVVVMDDVWSIEVWDDLKRFFPNNSNGSRIMIATRDSIVASSLSSSSNINRMHFLNSDRSWELFCQKVFSKGDCPHLELEEVGKNIAQGCKGLPLSIVVIGSMLASSEMTTEYWEHVAKDVNSFRNSEDDGHCLEILFLSYNNLPIHLKACFLQMSRFCEDSKISISVLLDEWIAEGFILPIQNRSLESMAKEYFMTLVNRNLVFIHEYYVHGEMQTCGLHDIVRDLCRRENHKEHFIRSPKYQYIFITTMDKVCFCCDKPCGDKEELNFPGLVPIFPSSSKVSLLMCDACAIKFQHIKRLSLVKVMDNVGQHSCKELVHATKMQFIAVEISSDLKFLSPSFVHLLWRLQTLAILASDSETSIVLPSEIWKMPQLRQIGVDRAVLTDLPASDIEGKDFIVLKYLHDLRSIRNFIFVPEVFSRIPNLKHLGICEGDDSWVKYSLCNLANFDKLESLRVHNSFFTLENTSFPNTLKRLFLGTTRIPWKDMGIIGSLPNLELLRLINAFIGPDWNPTEGEFLQLKVLIIDSIDLLNWRADERHFPNLEKLVLRHMHQLEIPSGIGDIPSLKLISLFSCGNSVINSAKRIWEEQQDYINEMLRVEVYYADGSYYEFGDEI